MKEYIIGMIYALDLICNFGAIIMLYILNEKRLEKTNISKCLYGLLIIFILGIILIPNKETLYILFN